MDGLNALKMTVNGRNIEVRVTPDELLVDVLREKLRLTGTKKGCGEGECGACTVIMDGKTVNSCLVPALKAQNSEIITIEGLEKNGELHPIQEAFIEQGAVQCGFCTPGVILSAKSLLDQKPFPSDNEIKMALSGHLCRCTGYVKFITAVKTAAAKLKRVEQ